ncbi:MAG TPA: hypothetical protein VGR35_01840 [Tepidisphaeraceae bacterium]|nr:hypothetical protein [Tepidisphaeraceae bacterium]
MLSVRLPKELDRVLPRKDRSAWVIDAIRERLRRERISAIARSAAENADEELAVLAEWSKASAPLAGPRPSRRAKR